MAIFASLLSGGASFFKFFGAISGQDLMYIVFIRMFVTFIIFHGIGFIIKRIISWQIPQLLSKQSPGLGERVDYSFPATTPLVEEREEQAEAKGVS